MEELSSLGKTQEKVWRDPAMEAAQQLMQLSNEENFSSCISKDQKRDGEEVDQKQTDFPKKFEDSSEICRPKKKRYRFLDTIYMETKPMRNGIFRKKIITNGVNPSRVLS